MGPGRGRIRGLTDQVEMIDLGIAQGVDLMSVSEGHKDLLPDRDMALFGDHKVEEPAGNTPVVGHVVVHDKRKGNIWGGAQILVAAIQGYCRALRVGDDLEGPENALGAKQAGHQGQSGECDESRFHFFLLRMNDSTDITRPAKNPAK